MSENLLRHEASPYLLQHKDNPVHWRPWGAAALAEAQREGKPILLSVGYAACHWCHVMAHESFEDPATAAVMNRLFVNIKVDREERPDIDQIYMAALHATGEQGGWPLTMFLTPAGEPIWGGTYFPKRLALRPSGFHRASSKKSPASSATSPAPSRPTGRRSWRISRPPGKASPCRSAHPFSRKPATAFSPSWTKPMAAPAAPRSSRKQACSSFSGAPANAAMPPDATWSS